MKYTDKDLFEFVYRADTTKKICIAEKWLTDHRELTSKDTFNELMMIYVLHLIQHLFDYLLHEDLIHHN